MRVLPIIVLGGSAVSTTFANEDPWSGGSQWGDDWKGDQWGAAKDPWSGGSQWGKDDDDNWNGGSSYKSSYGHDDDDDYKSGYGKPNAYSSYGGSSKQWGDWGTGWG